MLVKPRVSVVVVLVAAGLARLTAVEVGAARRKTIDVVVTSPVARTAYLSRATLWREPPALTPAEVLEGPPGIFPYTVAEATADAGLACAFVEPGRMLGGKSQKFACTTPDGEKRRVKFWDPEKRSGNREVFAGVAATRLLWALGFVEFPGFPLTVRCDGCPENPMEGGGSPATRRYLGMWQIKPKTLLISKDDDNQGWSWRELRDAIRSSTAPDHVQQQTYFDALTLLGVLIQHGDRKPEQQALYCEDEIDLSAGEPRKGRKKGDDWFAERAGATACAHPAAAIVDLGATFGGAGRTSNGNTAKMNLDSWRHRAVFKSDSGCRGDITISMAAGDDGLGSPEISEAGRTFLLERLRSLTPAHVRAIFQASRIDHAAHLDAFPAGSVGTDPIPDPILDQWVALFQEKVQQIEARHCPT